MFLFLMHISTKHFFALLHLNIWRYWSLKGIIMKILSSFTHPQVVPSSVWMSLFCWTQKKIFWRMWETEQFWGTIDFHSFLFPTMEVNGAPKQPGYKLSSKYLPLCSAEQRNSYRFGTTWGWVNDDRIFIFGWTIPLNDMTLLWNDSVLVDTAGLNLNLNWPAACKSKFSNCYM